MLSENLYSQILLDPVQNGADGLCIVSGYATAAMADRHIKSIEEIEIDIKIKLIVGMCPVDGISLTNHKGFKHLVNDKFECSYLYKKPAVHSKIYVWTKSDRPLIGFVGSANYTQMAFYSRQREAMAHCDPNSAFSYFQSIVSDAIYCTHNDAENVVGIYRGRKEKDLDIASQNKTNTSILGDLKGLSYQVISLLTNEGDVGQISGLNWGQRPNRNKNQAYIALRAEIYNLDFFPERPIQFTVLTDDNKTLICTRAQDNSKAIEMPQNNSLLGKYFRNRLNLASGQFVKKEHLEQYGRTDVTFYKIDDETYFMDFSV